MLWNNVKRAPERWAAAWLRRRGWVAFYLEPHSRSCQALCWLWLYEEEAARDGRPA